MDPIETPQPNAQDPSHVSPASAPEGETPVDATPDFVKQALIDRAMADGRKAPSYRKTLNYVRRILGPQGRVWRRNGMIAIGMQKGDESIVYGMGLSYVQAFADAFVKPGLMANLVGKGEPTPEASTKEVSDTTKEVSDAGPVAAGEGVERSTESSE